MNKYSQLIEYIINDQEDKARALFHSIVVAKSRDIYESLMDETVDRYDQQGDLVDDITRDETMEDDEFVGELGDESDEFNDEFGDDEFGDDETSSGSDLADKFQDIKSALEELEAEFQAIVDDETGSGSGAESEVSNDEFSDEYEAPAGEESDFEVDSDEESPMGESTMGSGSGMSGSGRSGSGRSGSGKSGSGRSGSGMSGSGKSGSGKSGSGKSAADVMREYVEKISAGHGAETKGAEEGTEIGSAGSKVNINKAVPNAGKNDMGGTTANIVSGKGNDNSERDGTTPKGKASGVLSTAQELDVAKRNVNKVGGNKGAQNFYNSKAKAKSAEGSTTDGAVTVNKDSVGYPKN